MDHTPVHLPRWIVGAVVALLVLASGAVAAWSIELPYFAFSPGPVADALDAVRPVEGTPVHPPQGELLMLTVAVQQVNAYEVAAAAADPSIDLVRQEAIRREGETDEEYQERQLDFMDLSEQTAILVALDRLGVQVSTDGVEVVDVSPGLPAERVLRAGDLIREVDGQPVDVVNDIADILQGRSPGERVEVTVTRDGRELSREIELGESPQEEGRPVVGVVVQNLNPQLPVEIESGNIGGPSAGLMYTLAVMDLLEEGDLTNGHVVAGTGTIDAAGDVGPIGGIRQKVVAAEAAGAEIMLVPQDNYQAALGAPRETMELVPVASVDEALAYLRGLPL